MAIRVYELSKKLGISNKELLSILQEHGFQLTALAVLPANAAEIAEKIVNKKNSAPSAEIKIKKEHKPEQKKAGQPQQKPGPVFIAPDKIVAKHKEPVTEIELRPIPVGEFAQETGKQVSEVILTLLKQGIIATKNQMLQEKSVRLLAEHYGLTIIEKKAQKTTQVQPAAVTQTGTWEQRLPIVVVIGHVDHGKTTLLDTIRKTRVAAKEKGGITQHLGAYEVTTAHGNIVFLDTPGHEAFILMRARGIKIADIAILVVAADDGVMPQTVEAIARAKDAGIPLIVAINKIDKATPAQIETIKRQLAQHDLVPEEWGGQTVCMPISAKLGTGIDQLLDVITLQAQLMDLKANITIPARGSVIESKMEKGRGPVATVICLHGILHVGDYFLAGHVGGKVSSLVDSAGRRVREIHPSLPVQVAGFSELPHAGDIFEVVSQEAARRGSAAPQETRADLYLKKGATTGTEVTLIIKADNASSREALVHALTKLHLGESRVTIVSASVGDITESDVMLAADTGSFLYGFHVRAGAPIVELASKKGVTLKIFDIIYKLLEDVEAVLEAGKPIKMVTKKIGEALVLKVFDIKGLGIIAGSQVKSGRFVRDGKVAIWRGKQKVGEGTIKGLQRERKAVKEVHAGFECGLLVDGFDTWQVDDRVECFQEMAA